MAAYFVLFLFADAPVFEPLFSSSGVQTIVTERAQAGIAMSMHDCVALATRRKFLKKDEVALILHK